MRQREKYDPAFRFRRAVKRNKIFRRIFFRWFRAILRRRMLRRLVRLQLN